MARVTLNIGWEQDKTPDSIGVDITKTKGVDVLADVQYLPFKTSIADKIVCCQLLEHVDNLIMTMEEMHRVLKPKGRAIIEVPHVRGLDAFRDPTHKHFFTIGTMNYFSKDCNYCGKARFKIIDKRLKFKPRWLAWLYNLRPEFTEHFLIGYFKPHIHRELERE